MTQVESRDSKVARKRLVWFAVCIVFMAIDWAPHRVAAGEKVLHTFTGRDVQAVRPFAVRDRWEIRWEGKGQILQIYVHKASGEFVDLAANQSAPGAGASFQPKGGRYYLKINGMGEWTVTVVQLD